MFYITKQNIENLTLGSLFCSTGGGLSLRENKEILFKILKKTNIIVKDLGEFNDEDYLASIYLVFDPSTKNKKNLIKFIKKNVEEYERINKVKIKGIIPGEIGAESTAFYSSFCLGLPVVDSDLVGGRAAPEIQMDVFSIYKIPITPVLAAAPNKKSILLTGSLSAKEIEDILRKFFKVNGGVGLLVGYLIKAADYKKIGERSTISRALEIGSLLKEKKLNLLLSKFKGRLVAREKIKQVDLKGDGKFLRGFVTFESLRLWIKNENIALFKNGRQIISAPTLIVVLDKDLKPIHNSMMKKYTGKEVNIISMPACHYWRSKSAKKLWQSAFS